MKKTWLNFLLVIAMLLVSVTPAFAQEPDTIPDEAPPEALPDGNGGLPDGFEPTSTVWLPFATTDDGAISVELDGAEVSEADAAATGMSPARVSGSSTLTAIDTGGVVPQRANIVASPNGRARIVVRMTAPAVAAVVGAAGEDEVVAAEVQSDVQRVALSQQDKVIAWIMQQDPSATVLARLQVALNAVIFDVNATVIPQLAGVQGVAAINPVVNYEMDLTETVPAIGGTAAHGMGFDGTGIRVAVLDSGIDYTHADLSGPGTVAAYDAAFEDAAARDGLFPTAKVIEGIDFVGEDWPDDGDETIDPDPIDFEGHGTHVADIIAGINGVAPGASLIAVKVCSSISPACSGLALLQGMEYAMDPDGNGNVSDAVDVINMSLGSSYGQIQDDLTLATENAVKVGIVVAAAAGNDADLPYIVSSPSSAPSAISVAQTTVPSDKLFTAQATGLTPPAQLMQQPFAGPATFVSAPLAYPAAPNQNGCTPTAFPPDSYKDKILIVDRGNCNISTKIFNGEIAGALAVIVANNIVQGPGDMPPVFSTGGESITIPGYSTTLADSTRLKGLVGQTVTIDPASAVNVAHSMVSSSARGPSYSFQAIKPDIGAPGASVSAVVGTGDETEAFGGTSGATPMIAGSAALVLDAMPNLKPFEVRALLMNNASTEIYMNPVAQPGYLAPITRIGGGEVRVNEAVTAKVIAYEKKSKQGSLSFGYNALPWNSMFKTTVEVKNLTNQTQTYNIARATRYANDAWGNSWAVRIHSPNSIRVPARGKATFDVALYIYANELPTWALNGGALGGSGWLLQDVEFDGYITLAQGSNGDRLTIPWQILPRKAADVSARYLDFRGLLKNRVLMTNFGQGTGTAEIFALTGTSPRIPKSQLPGIGENLSVTDMRAVGVRVASDGVNNYLQVGISTYGFRSHPALPASFDVYIDLNNDGTYDADIFTIEESLVTESAITGKTRYYIYNMDAAPPNVPTGMFGYADADLDSGNMIFTIPYAYLGITPAQKITMSVEVLDDYFTGIVGDGIEDMVVTPGKLKFGPTGTVTPLPFGSIFSFIPVKVSGGAAASPSQSGFLMLYRSQRPDYESDIIKVK